MTCATCEPPTADAPGLAAKERLHPGHVALRLGDVAIPHRVVVDGEDVSRRTLEADSEAGWAHVLPPPTDPDQFCVGGGHTHVRTLLVRGAVTVERVA